MSVRMRTHTPAPPPPPPTTRLEAKPYFFAGDIKIGSLLLAPHNPVTGAESQWVSKTGSQREVRSNGPTRHHEFRFHTWWWRWQRDAGFEAPGLHTHAHIYAQHTRSHSGCRVKNDSGEQEACRSRAELWWRLGGGHSRDGETWMDSGHILEAKETELAVGLNIGRVKGREIEDNP